MPQDTAPTYDLVLSGGTIIDPANSVETTSDLAVSAGRIAHIGPDLAPLAAEVIDCEGAWVLPGLVEGHTHIFAFVSQIGAPAEEAHLRRGVVAAADAGTAGASTFPAFERFIADPSDMRIVSFVNVSALGLIDFRFGELRDPEMLAGTDAVETARAFPGTVRGFKMRLSEDVVGGSCLPLLKKSVEVASEAGLPLMVHIGETVERLDAILDCLRPGDIVSHCYTGKPNGILEGDTVMPAVWDARDRGVLFDSAHGKSNLSFSVARHAIAEGFLPDVISSDTSARNWRGPVFDLVTTMAKFVALGIDRRDLVERVTISPARMLGLETEGFGSLTVGGPAHVTVLREAAEAVLVDAAGEEVVAPRLEPSTVLLGGRRIDPAPWRGPASAA